MVAALVWCRRTGSIDLNKDPQIGDEFRYISYSPSDRLYFYALDVSPIAYIAHVLQNCAQSQISNLSPDKPAIQCIFPFANMIKLIGGRTEKGKVEIIPR